MGGRTGEGRRGRHRTHKDFLEAMILKLKNEEDREKLERGRTIPWAKGGECVAGTRSGGK